MEIHYSDAKLERCARIERFAKKQLGPQRAKVYLRRIAQLTAATTFEDLRNAPGHFHQLSQDRKGQWSFDLDQPYRLIIECGNSELPIHVQGGFDWSQITVAVIVEIVDYH